LQTGTPDIDLYLRIFIVVNSDHLNPHPTSRIRKEEGEIMINGKPLLFGVICFRGYYPDSKSTLIPLFVLKLLVTYHCSNIRTQQTAPYKANQDEYAVINPAKWGAADKAMFAVFDGHGHVGEKCARFTASNLPPAVIAASEKFTSDALVKSTLSKTFIDVNKKLHVASDIDDTLSGTTAVVAMVNGTTVWYAARHPAPRLPCHLTLSICL
jgi:hypothetical protein